MVWQLILALHIIWIFNIFNLSKITGIHYNGDKPTIMAPLSILRTPKPIFTILYDILNIIPSLCVFFSLGYRKWKRARS